MVLLWNSVVLLRIVPYVSTVLDLNLQLTRVGVGSEEKPGKNHIMNWKVAQAQSKNWFIWFDWLRKFKQIREPKSYLLNQSFILWQSIWRYGDWNWYLTDIPHEIILYCRQEAKREKSKQKHEEGNLNGPFTKVDSGKWHVERDKLPFHVNI